MYARLALGICCVHSQVLPHNPLHYTMQPRCVCVCQRYSPSALRLARCSDYAEDRPRAPLLHCSRQSGMLSSQEQSASYQKIILQCREGVIIAIRAPIVLGRPAARAGSSPSPSWASFQGEICFIQVIPQKTDCRLLYQL